jgi:hypothetical protein
VFPVRYELECYISSICILRTQCVYVFRIILTVNSDYISPNSINRLVSVAET